MNNAATGDFMKCEDFAELAAELTDGRLQEVAVQQRLQAHAAVCLPCARSLAAQENLSQELRTYADWTAAETAAPRVKQELRTAFRAQLAANVTPGEPVNVATVLPFVARKKQFVPRWLAAVAAGLAIVFMIGALWLGRTSELIVQDTAIVPPAAPLWTPSQPESNATVAAPETKARSVATTRQPIRRRSGQTNAWQERETASDFVPLTLAADERALANGTLVRLEVPRARLVALGLPLPVESGREMVNAEVMVGDNGVAYAIRLVQ